MPLSNHTNWSDCCLGNFILQADNTGVVSIATPKLQLSSANNGLLASIQIKMKIIITQHTLIPKDLMMKKLMLYISDFTQGEYYIGFQTINYLPSS